MADPSLQHLAALLRWYEAAGVDATAGDSPRPFTAPPKSQAVAALSPALPTASALSPALPTAAAPTPIGRDATAASRFPPTGRLGSDRRGPILPPQPETTIEPTLPMGREAGVADARKTAAACATLAEVRSALEAFQGCALRITATRLVFQDGNPAADLMIVGEAPGADEDRQGVPFVGKAGQLLDRMLRAIGIDRTAADPHTGAYIANVVPWRPPGNRRPNAGEVAVCLPFIQRQIALARPRVLVLMGNAAAQSLLDTTKGISSIRGRWHPVRIPDEPDPIPALPTFHPAYLLRSPGLKAQSWRDLRVLKKKIDSFASVESA